MYTHNYYNKQFTILEKKRKIDLKPWWSQYFTLFINQTSYLMVNIYHALNLCLLPAQGSTRTTPQTQRQSAAMSDGTTGRTTAPKALSKELTRRVSTGHPWPRQRPLDCATADLNSACWSSSSFILLPLSQHPTMPPGSTSPPAPPTRNDGIATRLQCRFQRPDGLWVTCWDLWYRDWGHAIKTNQANWRS